jgi:uncharacterized membrane protein YfcA
MRVVQRGHKDQRHNSVGVEVEAKGKMRVVHQAHTNQQRNIVAVEVEAKDMGESLETEQNAETLIADGGSSRRPITHLMRSGKNSHIVLDGPVLPRTTGAALFSQFLSSSAHPVHSAFEFDWSAVQHWEVLWCCFALVPLGILHSAAGIGGGGVYVVILMLISKLEPYDAVPLSKVVIFMGAVAYSLATWVYEGFIASRRGKQVSNTTDGVACGIVIPMTLCGTSWGVYFNRFAPDYVIVGGLNVVLFIMTCAVMWQAMKQYMAEDQAATQGNGSTAISASPQDPDNVSEVALRNKKHAVESFTNSQSIVGVILLVLIVCSSVAYYRYEACAGGGTEHCARFPLQLMGETKNFSQSLQWVLAIPLLLCAKVGLYSGVQAYRHHDWSIKSVIAYLATGFGTGVVSGLVGVGGGLIFSPFFVISGMAPAVAVGTSSLCVLFTSASTTFSYLLTDRVIISLALVFGFALAPASVAGAATVQYLQNIPRSKSYISFIVAIGIMVSLVCSTLKMSIMVQKFEEVQHK